MKKLLYLILAAVIISSCGRKSTDETSNADSIIRLDLLSDADAKLTKLSEIADNVEYIPLETTESSLIGPPVLKVINTNNRIYLRNSGLNGEIFCFDMDGKFLYKLQNRGRGPEEYTDITDFDISSDNKFLIVLTSLINKLLLYEISDTGFTFRRSITLKDPAPGRVSMVPETEKIFLAIPPWTGSEPTLSLLINTDGDTIHYKPNCYKYERVGTRGYRATNEMLVYSIGNMVCFKEEFSDTVFFVDIADNSFRPRTILNSHGTLNTPEIRGGLEQPGNNSNYIANIFETSRYIFYYYISSGPTRNRFLFDKMTKEKYRLNIESELKDDLIGGPGFNIEFLYYYCSGGKLFSFVEALTLKQYVDSEDFRNAKVSYPEKKEELKKLADSLDESDNAVLIVVTPKK